MKKIFFLVLIITVLIIPTAFAQFRLDLGLNPLVKIGLSTDDPSIDSSIDIISKYFIPVPDAFFGYQASLGPLKVGGGLRAITIIIESIAWPYAYAELNLSSIVINAGIGGGAFMVFGLINHADTLNLFIPDISIAYKFGDTFRMGIGAMGFTNKDMFTADTMPYVIYLTGRFSILFDE